MLLEGREWCHKLNLRRRELIDIGEIFRKVVGHNGEEGGARDVIPTFVLYSCNFWSSAIRYIHKISFLYNESKARLKSADCSHFLNIISLESALIILGI